jgi:hypothetical protein
MYTEIMYQILHMQTITNMAMTRNSEVRSGGINVVLFNDIDSKQSFLYSLLWEPQILL